MKKILYSTLISANYTNLDQPFVLNILVKLDSSIQQVCKLFNNKGTLVIVYHDEHKNTQTINLDYNDFFIINKIKYNIVLISSKVYTSNVSFNYTPIRSIYTSQERYEQLLDTINSVQKYIPNYIIILIDNSKFTLDEYNLLNTKVNYFLNEPDNLMLDYYTNVSIYKSLGEVSQLLSAKYIVDQHSVYNLFKITGRYVIDESFDYKVYNTFDNIFKKNHHVTDRDYYYTCFYKISSLYLDYFWHCLYSYIKLCITQEKYCLLDVEVLFPQILEFKFKLVDHLGIRQNIAVWKDTDLI